MKFTHTPLLDAYEISLDLKGDSRGWLARIYCAKEFEDIGFKKTWVQMNHTFTSKKGSIRGLHFQIPPYSEIKLVRCIAGEVWDVIIDLRKESPTFLQWYATLLSAQNRKMLYIPEGFAHGFQTLTKNCEMLYCHSAVYENSAERGIKFDDSSLNIAWPLPLTEISERDLSHPYLKSSTFKEINF